MAEYGEKQRNQLSKVISRKEPKNVHLQRFADNRPQTDSPMNLIHSISIVQKMENGSLSPIQFGKDKKKRSKINPNRKKGPKSRRPTGPPSVGSKLLTMDIEIESDEGIAYKIMSTEGSSNTNVFEEKYDKPELFWRGDNRGPDEVFKTGFTTKNERDGKTKPGKNQIIWREGGATDDILPASAVCLAKDIRGSAFFPLTGEPNFYIYAVAKTNVVNTFEAQKMNEKSETEQSDFKRKERYVYDPEYSDEKNASAVWQFKEYAAHRVKPTEMLACFEVERRTIVPPQEGEDVAIAGIQFRLKYVEDAPIHRLSNPCQKELKKDLYKLLKEAKRIAEGYADFYPENDKFLSYMGIVAPLRENDPPTRLGEAKEKMKQIQPIVVEDE